MQQGRAPFIWETHGIHAGTIVGPIKHGIDDIDAAIGRALELGSPSICFVIHTPRLTTFRYRAEESLNLKFIRGDTAFARYVALMEDYKRRYAGRIDIRFGIELEWQGLGLGVVWSRAKIEQVLGVDFIIGSIHFAQERLAYDGSKEEAEELLAVRGSREAYWESYLDEVITMLDAWGDFVHVLGHLDLPKLYVAVPDAMRDPGSGASSLARKLRTILWKLADKGIALDVNLSGWAKGCGAYPSEEILRLARDFKIAICLGTDTHALDDIGKLYEKATDYVKGIGFSHYLSFRGGRPQIRLLSCAEVPGAAEFECTLNAGLSLIAQMNNPRLRRMDYQDVSIGLGEKLSAFHEALGGSVPAGSGTTIVFRKDGHSLIIGRNPPQPPTSFHGIYFKHRNKPGIIALFVSVLSSEGVNIDTAYLFNNENGTGEAYIAVSGRDPERVNSACEFAIGTNSDNFLELVPNYSGRLPAGRGGPYYINAIDDVEFEMAPAAQMVHSVHEDKPGILFVLLAALAARGVNVLDLRLTQRPGFGHALLAVEGYPLSIQLALESIRPEFKSLSYLSLSEDELGEVGSPAD
jgi:HisJ family histidinol phosphate phosphatase